MILPFEIQTLPFLTDALFCPVNVAKNGLNFFLIQIERHKIVVPVNFAQLSELLTLLRWSFPGVLAYDTTQTNRKMLTSIVKIGSSCNLLLYALICSSSASLGGTTCSSLCKSTLTNRTVCQIQQTISNHKVHFLIIVW